MNKVITIGITSALLVVIIALVAWGSVRINDLNAQLDASRKQVELVRTTGALATREAYIAGLSDCAESDVAFLESSADELYSYPAVSAMLRAWAQEWPYSQSELDEYADEYMARGTY